MRLSRRRAAATGARTTSPPPSALRARLRALLHGQVMAGAGRGCPGPSPDPARDQHYPLHVGPEQHRLTSRSPRPVRSHIALHRNRPSMIITKADRRTIYENLFKGESPLLPTPSPGRESARPVPPRPGLMQTNLHRRRSRREEGLRDQAPGPRCQEPLRHQGVPVAHLARLPDHPLLVAVLLRAFPARNGLKHASPD